MQVMNRCEKTFLKRVTGFKPFPVMRFFCLKGKDKNYVSLFSL